MMSEPPQTQEPGNPASCPKNPYGHSWQAVAVLEDRVRASLSLLPADQNGAASSVKASARAAAEADSMSQEGLAALIHEQTAAIAALEHRISTHEAIRLILRILALEEITLGQAIGMLAERAELSPDPEQLGMYQQAIDTLRQMQAEEQA